MKKKRPKQRRNKWEKPSEREKLKEREDKVFVNIAAR